MLKYNELILQKKKIENQLKLLEKAKVNIIKNYNRKNEKWLYDDNINCRKYCKLERHANYIKEKQLYKLGLSDVKPLLPTFETINNFIFYKFIDPLSSKSSKLRTFFTTNLNLTDSQKKYLEFSMKYNLEKKEKELNTSSNSFHSRIKVNNSQFSNNIQHSKIDTPEEFDLAL